MQKTILSLLLPLLLLLKAQAQTWQLNTEKDGIKVYTSTATGDAKVKPIKVECTFNATPAQLVAVLSDIKNYPDWVYHAKFATIVKQVSPSELYYYSEVTVPWPAQNRDFVSHVIITQNPETKAVTVEAPNVAGLVPQKPNLYRLTASKGKWIITPVGVDRVHVEYELQIDAGGNAPVWLVNLFATDGPLQSFKKLKTQLQKPEYKNATLPFIH
jgi:hypothetical protein